MNTEEITLCIDCKYRKGTTCQKKKIKKSAVIRLNYMTGQNNLVIKDIPRYRSVQIVRSDPDLCGHDARWFSLCDQRKFAPCNNERDAKIFTLAKSGELKMIEIGKLFSISGSRVGEIVKKAYLRNARFVEREKIHDLAESGVSGQELSKQFKVDEWEINRILKLPRIPLKS